MRIEFLAKTNKDYLMVNVARFELAGGGTLTIDRDETEYTIEDGNLSMLWRDCYIWEINGVSLEECLVINNDAFEELMDGAKLIELELEDDADDDYEVTDIEFSVG